jgi:hypothetical protein
VDFTFSGICAFDETFAMVPAADTIQCQLAEKRDGHYIHKYYLVNRQAALHLGQILINGLLLNNLKIFVQKKMKKKKGQFYKSFFVKPKNMSFSFTTKECLEKIKKIKKNYDDKNDNLSIAGTANGMSNIININNYQPNIHGYLNRNKNTWK